ncbi:MAG: biotin--[acetyl-CoA-carboxylase] ligase [Flavobacteriaceae bacterium]
MHIIKLDATTSTNTYLKESLVGQHVENFTVVVAKTQSQGRGQRGSQWISESGKNLTFSFLCEFGTLDASHFFWINAYVSVALWRSLRDYKIPDLAIKWPNDIMSGSKKIAGILIENSLTGHLINHSIVGIGLNVNQSGFMGVPNAASLKMVTGKEYDLNELLIHIMVTMESDLGKLSLLQETIWETYESHLFGKNIPGTFVDAFENTFQGTIGGVTKDGRLSIQKQDGTQVFFRPKEVKMVFGE